MRGTFAAVQVVWVAFCAVLISAAAPALFAVTQPPRASAPSGAPAGLPGDAIDALHPWDDAATYTSTVYVHPAGSDDNPGTRARPFRTVAGAVSGAAPGLDVVMLPGTYPPMGFLTGLSGTRNHPIRIRGSGTVTVVSPGTSTGLNLRDPRFVVLENITFTPAGMHAINVDDGGTYATPGEWVVLRNLRLQLPTPNGNIDCLKMSGIDHFLVTASEFTGCGRGGEGIDMVGCHRGVVSGNTFHDIPDMGVQTKGGSSDILIHGNVFRRVGLTTAGGHALQLGGGTDGLLVRPLDAPFEAERIQAIGNVIEASQFAAVAFVASRAVLVAHNTIVNPVGRVVRILAAERDYPDGRIIKLAAREGRFVNNLVVWSGDVARMEVGPGTAPETFEVAGNQWFDRGDPAFVDAAAHDYRLQPGSPARAVAGPLTGAYRYFDGTVITAPATAGAFK